MDTGSPWNPRRHVGTVLVLIRGVTDTHVFATHNTEYHLRGALCVAIRDRRTGEWLVEHEALGAKVTCMLARYGGQWRRHVLSPRTGSVLWFESVQVTTSAIRVCRPAADHETQQYPMLAGVTRVDPPRLPPAREDQTGRQAVDSDSFTTVDPAWLETMP